MTTYQPPPPPGQPPPPPAQKTGCGKIACIGCAVLGVLGILAFVALGLTVIAAIKSTDAYKQARDRAVSHPRVIGLLGSPVEASFFAGGTVKIENDRGEAKIIFPISGPKGHAIVHAEATRDVGGWTFTEITVKQGDRVSIDVLRP